jgi:hypothetical protein
MNCIKQVWLIAGFVAVASLAASIAGADYVTVPAGGAGGSSPYDLDCGSTSVLVGISGRSGDVVDSIGIVCRPVNANGTLGPAFTKGLVGGSGGTESDTRTCQSNRVANALVVTAGAYVNTVNALCGAWSPTTRTVGDTDPTEPGSRTLSVGLNDGPTTSFHTCPEDGQPAVGIQGRYGMVIDSIALVCDTVPGSQTTPQGNARGSTAAPTANPIHFNGAPPAGKAIGLSASSGGALRIEASGGTTPLTMTLNVMDSRYRPFFELVAPPPAAPPPPGEQLTRATTSPTATLTTTANVVRQQTASITRILKMKPGTPRLGTMPGGIFTVPISVTVHNASGVSAARAFLVNLQP